MSWDDYIKTQLIGTKMIDEACLAGLDGNIWATTPALGASQDQLLTLVKAMSCVDSVAQNGFHVGQDKYIFTSSEPGKIVRGRAKSFKGGLHVVLTDKVLILGRYSEPTTGGEAAKVVETLGDYLSSVGY